ncbi:MAG: sugar ABC transporter permease [Acutalibacteraceae bacterium]|nr:sugar ABC transporter permease [Acutalibacteraceae bacterium]
MEGRQLRKYFPVFVLPTLLAFTLIFLIPFIEGIYLSFTSFTTVADATFVGIRNYITAFADSDFIRAFLFTVAFAVVSVISINVLAFALALILTGKLRGTNFFRTVFFMPNLIGGIVLGYIWQLIINGILLSYGYSITSDAKYGFIGLIVLMNWQMIGYMMIIYIAGIQNIPDSILEAAKVDGASYRTTLRKIIIPSVMPSITICLFLTITNSFKLFDQNLALTAGAPAKETQMLALDIYNTFYSRSGYEGVGQAKAVIFFILVAAISLIQLYFTRKKENEA